MEENTVFVDAPCMLFNIGGKTAEELDVLVEEDLSKFSLNFRVEELLEEYNITVLVRNEEVIGKFESILKNKAKVRLRDTSVSGIVISEDIEYLTEFRGNKDVLAVLCVFGFFSPIQTQRQADLFKKVMAKEAEIRDWVVKIDVLYQIKQICPILSQISGNKTNFEFHQIVEKKKKILYLFKKDHHIKTRKFIYVTSTNDSVYFVPHLGGDDVTVNTGFEGVFINIKHDFYDLKKNTVDSLVKHCKTLNIPMIDDYSNIGIFFNRTEMAQFIENFASECDTKYKLEFPKKSLISKGDLSVENVLIKATENSLEFPLILKFEGTFENDINKLKNKMFIISNKTGLQGAIDRIESMTNVPVNLTILVQQYINHDGVVYKLYQIAGETHVFPRGSFPNYTDGKLAFMDDKGKGFLEVLSSEINSAEFKSQWKQWNYTAQPFTDNDYLASVAQKFTEVAKKSLFGMDFIFSPSSKTLYLIDINYFPGYKELVKEEKTFMELFAKHVNLFA